MSVRIEVTPDGRIEIMRPRGKASHFVYCHQLDGAMRIVCFLLKRDLEAARRNRFVPQIMKEARKELKQLERSRHGKEG